MFWATDWPTPSRHDARLCWADFAQGGMEVHRIPGSHGSFRFEPHVRGLAEKLDMCLNQSPRCLFRKSGRWARPDREGATGSAPEERGH